MLYVPKISPIRIAQLGTGDNLPQDLGAEFYGVDYVNFCNEWKINEPLTFQILSDSANPSVQVVPDCDSFLGDNIIANSDFSSWTGGKPDDFNVYNKGIEDEVNKIGNAIQLIERNPFSPRLTVLTDQHLEIGKEYILSINLLHFTSGSIKIWDISYNYPIIDINKNSGAGIYTLKFTAKAVYLHISAWDDSEITNVVFTDLIVREREKTLSPTDITPTGWDGLGSYVYEITYTPTTEDDFRFLLIEDAYFFESDMIKVVSDSSHLIKIQYSNSENDYGYVGATQLTAYVDGEYRTVQPANEMTVYENDRAEITKLRSTPTEKHELNIYNSPYYVANMLNMIFSCDTILINGEPFQSKEAPNVEAIEMSNLFDISVVISRTGDNYEYFTQTADGLDFIGDNSDEILSDNENKLIVL